MKMKIFTPLLFCVALNVLSTAQEIDVQKTKNQMMDVDAKVAAGAIEVCAEGGVKMLPVLRTWAKDVDPRLKMRARSAIGKITGQWASQTDVVWTLSMKEAIAESKKTGKPILMLHLFGRLNEEFC